MSDISPKTEAPNAEKQSVIVWAGVLALVVALVAAGYLGVILIKGPQQKPVMAAAPKALLPPSNTITAKSAPVPEPPKPEIKTMLAQIAKVEAAKPGMPGGTLYDPLSQDVALSFKSIRLDDPQVAEAQAALAKYLQAATWRERLPFVFEPERVEVLMQEQYVKRGEKEPEHGGLLGAGIITAGTSQVLNLRFACATRPDAGMRANFHRVPGGKLLLDWECWAAWSEKSWPVLKQERSQLPAVMRVIASESSYYNFEFSEKWRWLAVKLRSPDGLHNVTGYVERNTGLGIALANLTGVPLPHNLPDGTPMPALNLPGAKALVTLRLTFPNKAQSDHCVKITELLADRWLLFPGERK